MQADQQHKGKLRWSWKAGVVTLIALAALNLLSLGPCMWLAYSGYMPSWLSMVLWLIHAPARWLLNGEGQWSETYEQYLLWWISLTWP